MSQINVTNIQHESGAGSNITLDASRNVVCAADVQMASQNGGQLAGFRNQIINGAFGIWQRGPGGATNPGTGGNLTYTADRWGVYGAVSATGDRGSDVPSNVLFPYAISFQSTSIQQKIEIVDNASPFEVGSTWTLSYWAKGFAPTFAIDASVIGGGTTTYVSPTSPQYTSPADANGFTYNTYTFTFAGTAPSAHDYLTVAFIGGASDTRLTGVQLEPGPIATPFEHRPYATELALCQRYFQTGGPSVFKMFPVCYSGSGALALSRAFSCFRGVTMRAAPTETFTKTVGPAATVLSSGSTAQQIRVETDGTVPSDGEVRFRYDSANAEL